MSAGALATADFTASLWFNSSAPASNYAMFSNRANGSCGPFLSMRLGGPGRVVIEVSENTDCLNHAAVLSSPDYNDGQWHHVGMRRAGATLSLFIDGALVGSSTAAEIANVSSGQPVAPRT